MMGKSVAKAKEKEREKEERTNRPHRMPTKNNIVHYNDHLYTHLFIISLNVYVRKSPGEWCRKHKCIEFVAFRSYQMKISQRDLFLLGGHYGDGDCLK